ncbi:MAG TPA: nitrate reductase cytochrome c-type subunit [Geminicoccaceae bacterium]|nr:nitrate reductase cytochrome c-type subunit [Geminicoccus sp.]HMU51692.1 nitrate reductase cytochrome c-type subunit [Geminicoccaceae bacterium]
MSRRLYSGLAAATLLLAPLATAAVELTGLRGPTPLTESATPPPLPRDVNDDRRQARNWPEQPPVIPHSIAGYQITLNANKCLSCHGRQFTAQSQAPMISVTHFQDRQGQVLASVSPRRYFCTQCHVPQMQVELMVESGFEDIDSILDRLRGGGG